MDSDFTEENRQRCAEAARPLLSAVDELTTFASSPEFASKPAKISAQVSIKIITQVSIKISAQVSIKIITQVSNV